MQYHTADALILRAVDRGENDRLLTVLAPKFGRFYAMQRGGHSFKRREIGATEPFTYSNIEFSDKNGFRWIKSASTIETFPGIRYNPDKLFLAAYLADVAIELSDEREAGEEMLPLILNALHMLSTRKNENDHIKAVFELRAASSSGFMPEVDACGRCGAPIGEEIYLDVMDGHFVCSKCLQKAAALHPLPEINDLGERTVLCPLTAAAAAAFSFVVRADRHRIFSFRLTDETSKTLFSRACEAYLLHHLERGFESLENYKKLQSLRSKIALESELIKTEET